MRVVAVRTALAIASSGIVTSGYGKEYAVAIPGAAFSLVPRAGHLPQLENPEAVLALFADRS